MSSWVSSLVEERRSQKGLVDVFGLILFTDEHPNIKKVLRDDDYWSSLHEISGKKWAIFSIKPKKGSIGFPEIRPGQMGLMVPVWKEPKENKELLSEFGIQSTEQLPLFVAFTHIDGKIVKSELQLSDSSIDDAYCSIKKSVAIITEAINNILPENEKNPAGTHAAVALAIDDFKKWSSLRKGVDFYVWIKGLMP